MTTNNDASENHSLVLAHATNHASAGLGRGVFGSIASGALVFACSVWAFFPLDPAEVKTPRITAAEVISPATTRAALDLSAFNAPLWVTPAPPPTVIAAPAPPPSPPPPPLRWQLLAIVREGSGYKAMVYDPETDKVLSLAEGDESGARRVARVAPASMDVQDPSGVRTLALRDPAGGGQP